MRRALVNALTELIDGGENIYVLTADTGFHVFDDFQERFPDRFLNVGIAEAAMIGMAAGLAHEGTRVFCYGIAPFVTMRCFEQIRVDLCYPCLPVTIVGVGGGLTYGPAGATHHAMEDIALMTALPGMTVVCPGDPVETDKATEASVALDGPCYLRLGKTGEPLVHVDGLEAFAIGTGLRLRKGSGVAVMTTGNMLPTGVEVCDLLARRGQDPELISMHTVKPVDRDLVSDVAGRCDVIATVEEHSIIGGLGSIIAGVIADRQLDVRLQRFALPDAYIRDAGSQEYLRRRCGLTSSQIAEAIGP